MASYLFLSAIPGHVYRPDIRRSKARRVWSDLQHRVQPGRALPRVELAPEQVEPDQHLLRHRHQLLRWKDDHSLRQGL